MKFWLVDTQERPAINDSDEPLIVWLRSSAYDPMMSKIASRLEALSKENLVLMDSQRHLAEQLKTLEEYAGELTGRIARASQALGYVR